MTQTCKQCRHYIRTICEWSYTTHAGQRGGGATIYCAIKGETEQRDVSGCKVTGAGQADSGDDFADGEALI